MLGSVIKGPKWQWTAVGKHPAAADYIQLGAATPLLEALADWAAKGYQQWLRGNEAAQDTYSWRFWLRGAKKGTLICGLGRDSSDRIGRPFPLLIMGEGTLKGWEKNWMMLPAQLNPIWKRMEYMATHRYVDTTDLAEDLNGFAQPNGNAAGERGIDNWTDGAMNLQPAACNNEINACREQIRRNGSGMMRLQGLAQVADDALILQCHSLLNKCCDEIPRGVFIGGTPRRTCIAAIMHPLITNDFIDLWTV